MPSGETANAVPLYSIFALMPSTRLDEDGAIAVGGW